MPTRLIVLVACLFLAGALLLRLAQLRRGVPGEKRRRDWVKYAVYVGAINVLWASAYVGRLAAAIVLGLIVVAGTVEVHRVVPAHRETTAVAAALLLAAAFGSMLSTPGGAWRDAFAFVVLVAAATDSFAELVGRLLGRRKLCPRLSPQKTVAGFWGGLLTATALSLPLGFLLPGARGARLLLVGLLTSLGAVGGDLLFSAIKRAVGVKDFSAALPGHGGVLDRFDSLALAAPAFHVSRALLLAG